MPDLRALANQADPSTNFKAFSHLLIRKGGSLAHRMLVRPWALVMF